MIQGMQVRSKNREEKKGGDREAENNENGEQKQGAEFRGLQGPEEDENEKLNNL